MNSNLVNPKRPALIYAATVFLTFVFIYNLILGTGLIPGADTAVDARTRKLEDIAARKATVEGSFFDRNGFPISEGTTPGKPATVLFDEAYSHTIGYNSNMYGTSGLRKLLYDHLFYGGNDHTGAAVTLTTHNDLQQYCYDLLAGSEGSIIVMDAETGELLACASRSHSEVGYNVNEIDQQFKTYSQYNAFFLNRATMAQDTAGSIFKILTAASMLENDMGDYMYDDLDGNFKIGSGTIHNYKNAVYGAGIDLQTALNKSVNVYFASASQELNARNLQNTAHRFLFGQEISLDFTTLDSTFDLGNLSDRMLLAQTAYGQGQVAVSPLQIAMVMAGVINDGTMMKPYLIQQITDDGKTIYTARPEKASNALDKDIARQLQDYLKSTAESYGLTEELYGTVYAKTGTADQGTNHLNHIYFLAGAQINDHRYVILADRSNTNQTSGALKQTVSSVLTYLGGL